MPTPAEEKNVAVLVDCDNIGPEVLAYAMRVAANFGQVVLRRGYGNQTSLLSKWQAALVKHAFTPCLQFQYTKGKNTADIALAVDAQELLFDKRAETFCIVANDSDFSYLCRKLRERGAKVCVVGEAKTPMALRDAADEFFEWHKLVQAKGNDAPAPLRPVVQAKVAAEAVVAKAARKSSPKLIVEAVGKLGSEQPEGKVDLGRLGQYLREHFPDFTTASYGHSGLLKLLKTYDLLKLTVEANGSHTVALACESQEPGRTAPAPP